MASATQEAPAEQMTLSSLAGAEGIEWEDQAIALYLMPPTVGPAPARSLVSSIREVGVLSPVILLDDGKRFHVVDGFRRIAASRLLELTAIPARVGRAGDSFRAAISLVMNEQRSSNPVAEWMAIRDLQSEGYGEAEIARLTGVPRSTIKKRMTLGELDPNLREAFEGGKLLSSVAEAAARLPGPLQGLLVDDLKEGKKLTLARVEEVKRAKADSALASLSFAFGLHSENGQPPTVDGPAVDPVNAAVWEVKSIAAQAKSGDLSHEAALARIVVLISELEARI